MVLAVLLLAPPAPHRCSLPDRWCSHEGGSPPPSAWGQRGSHSDRYAPV